MNVKALILVVAVTVFGFSANAKESKKVTDLKKRVATEPISSATAVVDKDIIEKVKLRRKRYLLSYKKLPPLR